MSEAISVVYVDTDPERADSVATTLEEAYPALSVATVSDANVAIEAIETDDVECLVCECALGETTGPELFEHLRAVDLDLPCILCTDDATEDVVRETLSIEGTDYVPKSGPSPVFVLGNRIRQVVTARRTETMLEKRDAHHRALTRAAADAIITIDETGTISFCNEAAEETFGYDTEQLLGRKLTTLLSEQFTQRHLTAVRQYLEADQQQRDGQRIDGNCIEVSGRHRDGHEISLAISFGEFDHDGERFLTGIVRDITDRKLLEEDLQKERDLKDRIVETSPVGIAIIESDGAVSFLNRRAEEILSLPENALTVQSYDATELEFIDPDGTPIPSAELPFRRVFAARESVFDMEMGVQRPNDEQVWLSVNGVPLHTHEGTVSDAIFVFTDITAHRRYEERLTSLNELARKLTDAETEREVSDVVVTAARETLERPLTTVELYDEASGRLQPSVRTPEITDFVGDGPLFDADQDAAWMAFLENEQWICADLAAHADIDASETPLRSAIVLPLDQYGVFITGSTEPDAFSENDVELANILVANAVSALDRVDRERTLHERKNDLQEKTHALERVNRINDAIRGITQELIQASTREEVLQAVCDRLTSPDAYRFAWVGTYDAVSDEIIPKARAGVEKGYLDEVTVTTENDSTGQGPTGRALQTHDSEVQNDIASDPPFEPWRRAALERGYQSSIAVPLVYQDSLYGILNLYAGQSGIFDEMEAAVLTELGRTIGYALNALERKQALVSDRSVELEFRVPDLTDSWLGFVAETNCEFEFETVLQRGDGLLRLFFRVHGVPAETVVRRCERSSAIQAVTPISERGTDSLFECVFSESAFLSTLLDRGAVVRTVTANETEGRIIVRVPQSADIRTFVELFETTYEDATLVARREVDEPITTQQEFEVAFETQLTDRQEEVLQTAYNAGFFDSPRGSTAQEVGDILGVSQPTVSRHIRAGERKLFSLLFE